MYPHVIHRRLHSFRGQVNTLHAAVHKAWRAECKVFCLTLDRSLCTPRPVAEAARPITDGAKPVTTALSRVFPEFNHRVIHRLSPAVLPRWRAQ